MKKMMSVLLVFVLFFCLDISNCFAYQNDDAYNVGYAIGRALGGQRPGNDLKDFSQDKQYNFANIKRICTVTTIPPNMRQNVINVNMVGQYEMILEKIFPPDTFRPKVVVGSKWMRDFLADPATSLVPQEDKPAALYKYIAEHYDAVLMVQIYAYNRGMNNTGNCALDFRLLDAKTGIDIMYYKDFRLNAPRSWPEGMVQRITDRFKGKLEAAIEESKGIANK